MESGNGGPYTTCLDISMDEAAAVEVRQACRHVGGILMILRVAEATPFDGSAQITLAELHQQRKAVEAQSRSANFHLTWHAHAGGSVLAAPIDVRIRPAAHLKGVVKADDMGVVQVLEQIHLAPQSFRLLLLQAQDGLHGQSPARHHVLHQ